MQNTLIVAKIKPWISEKVVLISNSSFTVDPWPSSRQGQ